MAKKSKKIEKETRRLMEGITDLIKKKGDRYKFKVKSKKAIKKVRKTCPHWIFRKGKEHPTVKVDAEHPNSWKCEICGAVFPIAPLPVEEYSNEASNMLQLINQAQFYAIKFGGDADDTKMFLRLRSDLERFKKVSKNRIKALEKRRRMNSEANKKEVLEQFSNYSSFNYR